MRLILVGIVGCGISLYLCAAHDQLLGWRERGDPRFGRWEDTGESGAWKRLAAPALMTRWRRASMGVVMSLVLVQAGCAGSSGQPASSGVTPALAPTDYQLTLKVVDAAGERHATVRCTGDIQGTGYLTDLTHAFAACATAMADPHVALFLGRGEIPVLEPGCESESASAELRDAQAAIRLDAEAEHLERRLTVTDRCTELQWIDMSPLLQPESAPKVDP